MLSYCATYLSGARRLLINGKAKYKDVRAVILVEFEKYANFPFGIARLCRSELYRVVSCCLAGTAARARVATLQQHSLSLCSSSEPLSKGSFVSSLVFVVAARTESRRAINIGISTRTHRAHINIVALADRQAASDVEPFVADNDTRGFGCAVCGRARQIESA